MSVDRSMVRTVCGDVDADTLGLTLTHEHVIHCVRLHSGRDDNVCMEVELAAAELRRFKAAGGGAVCDVTPIGLGRDVLKLREVSEAADVTIVSGLGVYQVDSWPEWWRELAREQLADAIHAEAEGGATGVRVGLLGEIASHNEDHADWRRYRLTAREEDLFWAVGQVQQRTGLAVSTHASLGRGGVAQLQTLLAGGGDASRIVIGHCDACMTEDLGEDVGYYEMLLGAGAWVEFDLFGWDELGTDEARCQRVAELVRRGHGGRLLLSTDTCRRSQLHADGGRGFDYLLTTIFGELMRAGVSEEAIVQMTTANPARVLSVSG